MAGTGIMVGICTSPYPSPYPIEKVGDSPYPYPYPVNARIPRQNGNGFGQYPLGRVYLSSLFKTNIPPCTQGASSFFNVITVDPQNSISKKQCN